MPSSVEIYREAVYTEADSKRDVFTLFGAELRQLFGENIFQTEKQNELVFTERALKQLLWVADNPKVDRTFKMHSVDLIQGLKQWLLDGAHGVLHSYEVFQRMTELQIAELQAATGRQERSEYIVPHESLLLRAVLHDLGEFLPITMNPEDQAQNKEWRARKHAQLIAWAARRIGGALEVDDAPQLAQDLRWHDYFWSKPTADDMEKKAQLLSPAGRLLADADRLVGDSVEKQIERNRIGSLGKWHVLRDLSAEDRMQWRERTKGLFDGICALLVEFTGQDHLFYTETARAQNRDKKEQFRHEVVRFYQDQYRHGWQVLHEGMEQNKQFNVGIKGENSPPDENYIITPDMSDDQLREMFSDLINRPVPGKENDKFPGRQYFGYSVAVGEGATQEWLDPSILRFRSEQELELALDDAILAFEKVLARTDAEKPEVHEE
jgi:hypothetical protein